MQSTKKLFLRSASFSNRRKRPLEAAVSRSETENRRRPSRGGAGRRTSLTLSDKLCPRGEPGAWKSQTHEEVRWEWKADPPRKGRTEFDATWLNSTQFDVIRRSLTQCDARWRKEQQRTLRGLHSTGVAFSFLTQQPQVWFLTFLQKYLWNFFMSLGFFDGAS